MMRVRLIIALAKLHVWASQTECPHARAWQRTRLALITATGVASAVLLGAPTHA